MVLARSLDHTFPWERGGFLELRSTLVACKVLGATDPSTASEGSVRRAIFDKWEELGLAKQPSTGENGVHASASPLEGLFERMNWSVLNLLTTQRGSIHAFAPS